MAYPPGRFSILDIDFLKKRVSVSTAEFRWKERAGQFLRKKKLVWDSNKPRVFH